MASTTLDYDPVCPLCNVPVRWGYYRMHALSPRHSLLERTAMRRMATVSPMVERLQSGDTSHHAVVAATEENMR